MSYVLTEPDMVATAATDAESIGSALSTAVTDAAGPTTDLAAAAEDEVSAAVAKLFGAYAQEYQAIIAKAEAFHSEFTRALGAAANAYEHAETAATALLSSELPTVSSLTPTTSITSSDPLIALIMGGTGISQPDPDFVMEKFNGYIQSNPLFAGAIPEGLFAPEQFFPFTPQLGNLTFGQSVSQGVAALNDALLGPTGVITQGNSAVVVGVSQSAVVQTNEIRALLALPTGQQPSAGQLSFVMLGNLNNPDGGLFARFPGFYIPVLDVPFNGATPQSPWHTEIYTNQYDGIADFPQYPLNLVSDVNAVMGIFTGGHHYVTNAGAIALPTSPGFTGNTTYFLTLTQDLPLVGPLRFFGGTIGNAVADLLQPDLRVIVDLGYAGYGPGGNFANIPTPAGLFSIPDPFTVISDLATGAVQGIQAAGVDLGLLPASALPTTYPFVPSIDPQLHIFLGQPSTTLLSVASGALGDVFRLIPPLMLG